jgi:hypothetical protein
VISNFIHFHWAVGMVMAAVAEHSVLNLIQVAAHHPPILLIQWASAAAVPRSERFDLALHIVE